MQQKSPGLAVGPVLVLFGVVGILLIALLSNQPRIPPATQVPPTEVVVVPTATATEAAETASSDAFPYTDAEVSQGQSLFVSTCSACHGPDGRGIPGLGKDLQTSSFVHGLTDDELHQFIIVGRPVTDPLNTTGVAMPPKGANPSLTDDQIQLIIAFIRSEQVMHSAEAAPAPTATPASSEPTTEFQLPINSLGLATATPTTEFQLPINSLGLATATAPAEATTEAEATAEATSEGGFQLPINSMTFPTATLPS